MDPVSVRINHEDMSVAGTEHRARLVVTRDVAGKITGSGWEVSWLPGQLVTRNQAITAMVLASAVTGGAQPGDDRWPFVEDWAAELGMPGSVAASRIRDTDHTEIPPSPTRGAIPAGDQ